MKLIYVGFDTLYEALPSLEAAGGEVMQVVTFPVDNRTEFNLRTLAYARERGIPCRSGRISAEDIANWQKAGAQALVCCGYPYHIPTGGGLPMVNIHPALLPVGRGAWPMPVMLLRGLSESGLTVHKLTEAYDAGDILLQRAIPVLSEDTLETLTNRLRALLPELMHALLADFPRLYAEARPQGEGEDWPAPQETDYPLSPSMCAAEADRILRAFYGYECIYRAGDAVYGVTGGRAYRKPAAADATAAAEACGASVYNSASFAVKQTAGSEGWSLPLCDGVLHAREVRRLSK